MPFLTSFCYAPVLYCCSTAKEVHIILHSVFKRFCSYLFRNYRFLYLAFAMMAGVVCGVHLAMQSANSFVPLMRAAAGCRMSIVGLIASRFLPFLFAAFAVYIAKYWLLIPAFFIKGCAITWSGCLAVAAFGSAGWLVQPLLQFSDLLLLPVLFWFCIRRIVQSHAAIWRDLKICGTAFVLVGALDYCIISPFLVMLLTT